jgi:pilus assembly protein CpaE
VNPEAFLNPESRPAESHEADALTVALIGPDAQRRNEVRAALAACKGGVISEFFAYPSSRGDLPWPSEQTPDVVMIDLDSNLETALELVESACSHGVATVMVYSANNDPELLVRSMRAGTREFIRLPFSNGTMPEALTRAAARRAAIRPPKKADGRLFVFFGAKGGAGVTTISCNFAVALAQESSQKTLLIDLDFPLGDAALNLGVTFTYSIVNALENSHRLDSSLLSKLVSKHSSGVSVLAAPGTLPNFQVSDPAIDKLLAVARQDFENVVVDVGARLDLTGTALFKDAFTVYLVTQAGIPDLRNSNRLIAQFGSTSGPKLEVVVNRYEPRVLGVTDEHITKALTRPADWRIPNDYAAVLRMQHTATPIALSDSPISRQIRLMARSVIGHTLTPAKKKGFSLFR